MTGDRDFPTDFLWGAATTGTPRTGSGRIDSIHQTTPQPT